MAAIVMSELMSLGYLGAFLSPESQTHDAPFVIVNEDQGTTIGGQQVNFGEQVLASITAPNPALGDKVDWIVLPTREDALDRLGDKRAHAAIVIPATYSNEMVALMQLAAAMPPAPATIDVLLNSAAGAYPTDLAKQVTNGAVTQVSAAVNAQLIKAPGGPTAQIPVALSAVLANPVVANTLDIQPTGPHMVGSNSLSYYALLLTLAGFVGMDIIYLGLGMVTGRSTASPRIERLRGDAVSLSPVHSWMTRVLLSLGLAIIAGLLEVGVAVGMLDMATDRIVPLMLFGRLTILPQRSSRSSS